MLIKMLLSEHRCSFCKEIFTSEQDLNHHTENLRAFAAIFCKSCRKMCRIEDSQHHHNFLYYCKICRSYLTVISFLDHNCFHKKSIQSKASKGKVICDKCKAGFFSKKDLIDHVQECQILKNIIVCKCCKKQFSSDKEFGLHKQSMNESNSSADNLTCSQCQLSFVSEYFLNDHIKSNHVNANHEPVFKRTGKSKLKKYQCKFCQKQFPYKNDMTLHEKQTHSSDVVTCSICQKEMPYRRLGPHSRWHRTREKYKTKPRKVCDICGFASKFIARHMKIHKEERRYKCNICSKSFKLSSCLSNHKLVHSDVARHKCTICDKAFKSNFNLQVHLRSHDVVKPFPCLVCAKTFTTKQSRDNHLKTHDR